MRICNCKIMHLIYKWQIMPKFGLLLEEYLNDNCCNTTFTTGIHVYATYVINK